MKKEVKDTKANRELTVCIIIIFICFVGLFILKVMSITADSDKVLPRMMAISIAVTIFLSLVYKHLGIVYGKHFSSNIFNYPIGLLTVLCTLSMVFQFSLHATSNKQQSEFDARNNLSKFTHDTVIENWEKDTINYPELNPMYENIFSMSTGNNGYFLTQEQWQEKDLGVPYVSFSGNEIEWHFAAQFCQEMVNIIRAHALIEKFPVHYPMPKDNPFHSWLIKFRLFMKDPIVRNVWEQYRYHFANVHIDAWITHHIIEFVDKNPDFHTEQLEQWQREKARVIREAKKAIL